MSHLFAKQFKTLAGAQKRAAFDNAMQPWEVANGYRAKAYHHSTVRCVNGVPDTEPFDPFKAKSYTWRVMRETKKEG